MLTFYKHIVKMFQKKAKITILIFMKKSNNNNIILGFGFSLCNKQNKMDNLTRVGSVNGLLVNGLWYGIGRCVPYLIQAAKLLLAAALGDYRPEVSLEPSKLSLSSNLFSPEKLLMTGDDYLFRFKLALLFLLSSLGTY